MTDSSLSACRAALLKACEMYQHRSGRMYVNVDDAAACMARYGAECFTRGRTRTVFNEIEVADQMRLAALAAAQEER